MAMVGHLLASVAVHTWNKFIANYTTEGCPNPECLVCKRNRELKARMEKAMAELAAYSEFVSDKEREEYVARREDTARRDRGGSPAPKRTGGPRKKAPRRKAGR